MNSKYIIINGIFYEIAKTQQEVNVGMSKYNNPPLDNRVNAVYPYTGMLFVLKGLYSILTMRDMKYPLWVSFYDRNWHLLKKIRATPYTPYVQMPPNAYYMIELP